MSEPATRKPPVKKARCHDCGKRKPETETTLVHAEIGGGYNRSSRRGMVRVCRGCTIERVAFCRASQEKGRNTPLNSFRIAWEEAARAFALDISGLLLDERSGRREP